jgi:SAM-dependent methyltransferase
MEIYTDEFYKSQREGSRRSAQAIVPIVLRLIKPRSVIDVGCGLGTWLSVFQELGINDVLGLDGSYVDRSMLQIAAERFLAVDVAKPIRIDRQFELAVCLEVAEHLPKECARTLVESLTKLSPVVLFSAAIPFQGGTSHVNEQWPDYWASHFRDNDYETVDCIRNKVWQDDAVEWWYAQNTLVFCRKDHLACNPLLQEEFKKTHPAQLSLVHPKRYLEMIQLELTARELANLLPKDGAVILVDQDQLRDSLALGNRALPFLEQGGRYWGPPPDAVTAIRELERMHQAGADMIVFLWPAFWWLDYYDAFRRHLVSNFHCMLQNDRMVAFDLKSKAAVLKMT